MKAQQAFKQTKIFICAKANKIRKSLIVLMKQKRAHKMLWIRNSIKPWKEWFTKKVQQYTIGNSNLKHWFQEP